MIHRELCKKLKFDRGTEWYIHKPESILENETNKILWDFEMQTGKLILTRWVFLVIINKKKNKQTLPNSELYCLRGPQRKIKENEKRDKYLDFARRLKKQRNTMVTVIPIIIGALETIPKGLVKEQEELEIRGRAQTIQTTALLRSARILRIVLETWGDLLSLRLQW